MQHTRRASGSIEAGSGRHGTRLASVGDAPSVTAFAIFGHDVWAGGNEGSTMCEGWIFEGRPTANGGDESVGGNSLEVGEKKK